MRMNKHLVERHCPHTVDTTVWLTGQVEGGFRRLLSDAHDQRVGGHARRPPAGQGRGRPPARHGGQPARTEPIQGDEHEQEAL